MLSQTKKKKQTSQRRTAVIFIFAKGVAFLFITPHHTHFLSPRLLVCTRNMEWHPLSPALPLYYAVCLHLSACLCNKKCKMLSSVSTGVVCLTLQQQH